MSNYQDAYQPSHSLPSTSQTTSGLAITSLVLGIASFICTIFTGVIAIVLGIIALLQISGSNGRVKGNGMAIGGIVTGAMGCLWTLVLVGMLLPAIQQVRTAARRTIVLNNVRQICLASLNYQSAQRKLPSNLSANNPEAGENLSWRVHILPLLGRQDLYHQFNLDEPWDSPNNKALLSEIPEQYQHPVLQEKLPEGYTVFQMPTSPADSETPAILVKGEQGVGLGDITDGPSNTILILEVCESAAVPWTKPQDWRFDPDDPTRGVGDSFPGTFSAGFCDGSTHALERDIDEDGLKPLLTRSGGEASHVIY